MLPYLGVLVYLIARGRSMRERDEKAARDSEAAFRSYVRQAAGPQGGSGGSHVDDLTKLAELKDKGALSPEEYERAKAKILA